MGSRGKSLSASATRAMASALKEGLFNELRKAGIKHSPKDTKFITKDQNGKITWLEKGNSKAGLMHIYQQHASQFKQSLGIKKSRIANHIRHVIEKGNIVYSISNKGGTKRIYSYQGEYYTVVVTGSNGFIVTAYPMSTKKK